MKKVLRQYEENGYQITEYTKDGVSVSSSFKQLIPTDVPEPEQNEPQPTLEEQITRIREDNLILMDALALTFEEVMMLRAEIGGKV